MGRTGFGIGLFILVLLVAAWNYRAEVAIGVIGFYVETSRDIGPNRDVPWEKGPAEPAQPPSERPPNIVLILADDMGWNDVSTNGGGAGGGTVNTPNIDRIAREGVNFTTGYSGNGIIINIRKYIIANYQIEYISRKSHLTKIHLNEFMRW